MASLDARLAQIAAHFDHGSARRSFGGLLLTAVEGAYIRSRAERSQRPSTAAGAWLPHLAG
jgi:hypothetical protein